ncbi:MAG: hypothetical protein HQL82_03120 [Magnetococcales bacterium]|nr:hypothetical protein [Magnetococcales bacterium]
MSTRNQYSAEQLEQIRATLKDSLGDDSTTALDNLNNRFTPGVEAPETEKKPGRSLSKTGSSLGKVSKIDVEEVIRSGNITKMLEAVPIVLGEPNKINALIDALLKNGEVKSFHLVEALGKVHKDKDLVERLVDGIITRKGVNPLVDSLKFAVISPKAMLDLARSLAEQGTVNHILRAIAGAPKGQDEVEIIWTMEVIGKGTIDQMLDAIKLIETSSPGTVVLATGIVNRKGTSVESMVRALGAAKENPKAATILVVPLVKKMDVPVLISLMEKYLPDKNPASEIVAAQLVNRCLGHATRSKELATAIRFARNETMTAQILAWGLVKQDKLDQILRGYNRLPSPTMAKKMLAMGVVKMKGKLMSLKELGKAGWDLTSNTAEIAKAMNETQARYKQILAQYKLDEDQRKNPGSEGEEEQQA